ncbi:MAG: type II toxin-antitoxin system Phd/YefM family antitoxin [Dermatophilaceae bacterium]
MKETAETIGIRELRQHASRYIVMVKEGKRIAVTERGELVAYLEPVHETASTLERMRAAGLVQAADARGTRGLPPARPAGPDEGSLSEVVRQLRDEDRW